jgi:hypothetical protein
MRKAQSAILLTLLLSLSSSGFAAVREYLGVDPLPLEEGQTVVVDAWDVNVFARSGDTRVVQCSTDLRISGVGADKADQWILTRTPQFTSTENGLEISLKSGDEGFLGLASLTRRRRLGFVLPLTSIPDLTTSSGNIELEGDFIAANPLRLRTGSGTILFRGGTSSLEIRSTSGDTTIELFRPVESLSARTSSGSLSLSGGARSLEIETASGDITLSGLSGPATIESVSGHINATWDQLAPGASVKLRTFKGDIVITIPADATPAGTLITATGEIHSEFEGEINEAGDTVTLTGDGPVLDVETASGKIFLNKDRGLFGAE